MPLNLEELSEIETESVDVGGQTVTMTMLVPADIEKCRKLIRSKKLDQELAMEYMTFLGMKKAHPEVTWLKFLGLNFKTINKLMAVMAVMNGLNETFQAFGQPADDTGYVNGSDPEFD